MTQFLFEIEGAEGTPETLAAADVYPHAEEVSMTYGVEKNKPNPQRGYLGRGRVVAGKKSGTCNVRLPVVAGVDAATVPIFDKQVRCMGHVAMVLNTIVLAGAPTGTFRAGERITASSGTKVGMFVRMVDSTTVVYAKVSGSDFGTGETITGAISGATASTHGSDPDITQVGTAYRPISSSIPSGTAAVIEEGIRKRLFGSRGDGAVETEGVGQILYLRSEFMGGADKPVDQALLTGVTKPAIDYIALVGATVTAEGSSLCIGRFALNFGNSVNEKQCATAAGGVKGARIGDREPTIAIDPEATVESDIDFFNNFDADTEFAFYAAFGNSTIGEVVVAAAKAQYQELGDGERDEARTHEAVLSLEPDQGDDEYIIACIA